MTLKESVWTAAVNSYLTREGTTYQGAIEVADKVTAAFVERFITKPPKKAEGQ